MSHMELHVYQEEVFLVETLDGTHVLPTDVVRGWRGMESRAILVELRDFCSSPPVSYTVKRGWCARYSSSGFLDCTDWCGPYATEAEAAEECKRLYGDEDDSEGSPA